MEVVITAEAEADLVDIWWYTATHSYSEYADKLLEHLDVQFSLLATSPEMGAVREELGDGIRLFPVEKINILYKLDKNILYIVRAYHSAQDFTGVS